MGFLNILKNSVTKYFYGNKIPPFPLVNDEYTGMTPGLKSDTAVFYSSLVQFLRLNEADIFFLFRNLVWAVIFTCN